MVDQNQLSRVRARGMKYLMLMPLFVMYFTINFRYSFYAIEVGAFLFSGVFLLT